MRRSFLLLLLTICLFAGSVSAATNSQEPFAQTTVVLKGFSSVGENDFHDYWDPGFGGGFRVELPFYMGRVLFGYRRIAFTGDNIWQPDFDSAFSFFGIGQEWRVYKRSSLFIAGGFGNLKMNGDPSVLQGPAGEEDVFEETEFAYNVIGEVRYHLTDRITLNGGIDHTIVHTRKKIHLTNITAGIGYTFDSPNWLIGVLQ